MSILYLCKPPRTSPYVTWYGLTTDVSTYTDRLGLLTTCLQLWTRRLARTFYCLSGLLASKKLSRNQLGQRPRSWYILLSSSLFIVYSGNPSAYHLLTTKARCGSVPKPMSLFRGRTQKSGKIWPRPSVPATSKQGQSIGLEMLSESRKYMNVPYISITHASLSFVGPNVTIVWTHRVSIRAGKRSIHSTSICWKHILWCI